MERALQSCGKVILTDRKTLTLDGVSHVGSFDEEYVVVFTSLGEVNIEGEGLKIENLSKERGEILISGKITAIYYQDRTKGKKRSQK